MEENNQPLEQQTVFPYEKESVKGVLPYIRNSSTVNTSHWMIIFTSAASYFVYCGTDATFMPSRKGKRLEKETQNKNLEELLKTGRYFYRISGEQISGLHYKKGWLSSKVWFIDSDNYKVSIKLKRAQYIKFLELLPLLKAGAMPQNLIPAKTITKESLHPNLLPPVLTEEEQKQEKRRTKALGWVLLINAVSGLAVTYWLAGKGAVGFTLTAGIVPAIIDVGIAIALLSTKARSKNDTLKWVFYRSVLGLLFWGILLIVKHDWITFVIQIPYFTYLIYHSKVKATTRSFRIAMRLLSFAVIVLIAGTVFNFKQAKQTSQQYMSKLDLQAKPIDAAFAKQRSLVFFQSDIPENDNDIKARRKQVLDISVERKNQLEQIMPLLNEGLKAFPDSESQKYLLNLKTLYELESAQNSAVADLFAYIETINPLSPTKEQQEIYAQKEQVVYNAYEAVRQQAVKIQNAENAN